MQECSKVTKVELETSLIPEASLTEAVLAISESHSALLYNEELNREQLKLLDYSKAEIKYLALSIFIDPCILKGRHMVIQIITLLLYCGQVGGYAVFTYGFIQNNYPMVGLYLLLSPGSFLVGIGFRLALIFLEKTLLKIFLLRSKIRKAFPTSEACINEIRYPFTLALKTISLELEPETTYHWNLLTPNYNQNLLNLIPCSDEFQKICEDYLEWNHKSNGSQLLYAMLAYKFTLKTIYHAGMFVLMLVAAAMAFVAFYTVDSIVKYDIYGACLRLDMFVAYGTAGLVVLASSFSANHEYLMAPPPEEFISIEKLYHRPEERTFLIDVFSIETLETFMRNYFRIREVAKYSTKNQEYPFLFMLLMTLIGTGYAFILIYTQHSELEVFGYGFTAVLMFTMIVPLLFVLILHLFIGALFNQRPLKLIIQLKKLKDVYIQMGRLRQGKYPMSQLGQKMQFLFECIANKDIDFNVLEKKVDMMIEDIRFENETSPYKFLGVFECTTRTIAALLVGISGLLSLALVKYTEAVSFLIRNKFV